MGALTLTQGPIKSRELNTYQAGNQLIRIHMGTIISTPGMSAKMRTLTIVRYEHDVLNVLSFISLACVVLLLRYFRDLLKVNSSLRIFLNISIL